MACYDPCLLRVTPSWNLFSHCNRASLCDQQTMAEVMACGFSDSLSKPGAPHLLSSPPIPSSDLLFCPSSHLLLPPSLPLPPTPFSSMSGGSQLPYHEKCYEERCGEELKPSANRHVSELGSRSPQSNLQELSLAGGLNTISWESLSQSPQWRCSQVPEPQKLCEIMSVFQGAKCYKLR